MARPPSSPSSGRSATPSEEDHLLDPTADTVADRLALPPAIDRLERQLSLTALTLAWGRALRGSREVLALHDDEQLLIPASAADAARLAADLARLMDDVETAAVPWEAIRGLAPEDHAGYFQITLEFLKIAFEQWPEMLAEQGLVDPAARRDRLIRAEAERLRRDPPRGPVIAAGSTGTIPATAALLEAIASLPNGAVVLPGLDRDLDAAGFAAIGGLDTSASTYGHPQFGLKQLIAGLGVTREDIAPLCDVPPALVLRDRLASEALRPAETTDSWVAFRATAAEPREVEAALAGVSLVVAHNEQEEAVAIALAIREALEEGLARVALITPDRTLTRRVAAELRRWKLAIDDSAGARLDLLPEGIFARLLSEAVADDGEPAGLLALLKHPFAAFGMERIECRRAARVLELAVFRGRRGSCGLAGLAEALDAARMEVEGEGPRHLPEARKRLAPGDWGLAARLVRRLDAVLGRVRAAFADGAPLEFAGAAAIVRDAIVEASRDPADKDGRLWTRPRRRGARPPACRAGRGDAASDDGGGVPALPCHADGRRLGDPTGRRRSAHPHLGHAGSAAAIGRPPDPRRARRGCMAGRDPHRPVAVARHAGRDRPAAAGASHRPCRPRFRRGLRGSRASWSPAPRSAAARRPSPPAGCSVSPRWSARRRSTG